MTSARRTARNKIQAYSVYSDDHGATWHKGANVGDRMDENKTVELSDGRVLLNSRDNANQGYRKVAVSTDGGATYGPGHPGHRAAGSRQQRRHRTHVPQRGAGLS